MKLGVGRRETASLFCSKIRTETQKEELETTSACQRNMRSREPYVVWALEDERKETALVSYNDLDATLKGRIIHTLTPTPSFEYDTPVSNYISRRPNFHLQDAMSGSTPKKPVSSRAKKEITIGRQWLTFVVCASVRLRRFMGIFP